MPYVSIPARIEIGGVSAHGTIPVEQESGAVAEADMAHLLHLKVGINPLQGFNGWHDRSWDIGAGYMAQWFWPEGYDETVLFHGFHLEGAWFPWSTEVGSTTFRLCLIGAGEVILSGFTGESEIGPGGSLGAFIEWSGTASTAYAESTGGGLGSSAGSIGALYGEWGVGIGISAGYRRMFEKDFLTVMVGLSFRLPFGAGLMGLSS
jgi:hypothetical protein